MPDYTTRTFRPVDDPIAATKFAGIIDQHCRSPLGENLYRPTSEDWDRAHTVLHLVMSPEGHIAGGCATQPVHQSAYLSAVVADPNWMGMGAGGAAVDEAIHHAKKTGAEFIDLVVRLTDQGLPAGPLHIYHQRGFRLLPGVNVHAIEWADNSRHLWKNPDVGQGTFRTRTMRLELPPKEVRYDH